MAAQIFDVPGWSFSANDEKALIKMDILRNSAIKQLPNQYKSKYITHLFQQMSKTQLYNAFKTLPKGVIHHLHFDCSEDRQFVNLLIIQYKKYIVTDPIVYLTFDLKSFQVGTKQQALKQGWLSMKQSRQKFDSQQIFLDYICNITMLSKKQIIQTSQQSAFWELFQQKIENFFPLLRSLHIYKKYISHVLKKYINNGYDRIQFRGLLSKLNQYNQTTGQLIKTHEQQKFMEAFDNVYNHVKKQHPILSVGFIFFGLRLLPDQQNEKLLTTVLQKKWQKTVGIDFVQQEADWNQQPYDRVADKVLSKFPDLNVKKVYHAGETANHLNNNIEIAIKGGSVRIGHGINILQHPQLIEVCKQKGICFEKNPISNLLLGYVQDPRKATAQLLLGLGVPVTINPDDPGKFGLQDSTMDYFVTFISTNWTLRHLKLIALHSINYSLASQQHKKELHSSFNKRWDAWIEKFINVSQDSPTDSVQITKEVPACNVVSQYGKNQTQNVISI